MIGFWLISVKIAVLFSYSHDVDSGDEENAPMFGSFDTASPRHSIVSIDPSFIHSSQNAQVSLIFYQRLRSLFISCLILH